MNTGAPAVAASGSPPRFGPPARNTRIRREEHEDADERFDGNSDDEEESGDEENISDGNNSDNDDNMEADAVPAPAAGGQLPRWVEEDIPRGANIPPEDWLNDLEAFDDAECGPRVLAGVGDTPYDYWKLFITDEILDTFVKQTNFYGARKRGDDCQATHVAEMKRFFAVIVFMGLQQLPSRDMYWHASEFFSEFERNAMRLLPSTIKLWVVRIRLTSAYHTIGQVSGQQSALFVSRFISSTSPCSKIIF